MNGVSYLWQKIRHVCHGKLVRVTACVTLKAIMMSNIPKNLFLEQTQCHANNDALARLLNVVTLPVPTYSKTKISSGD